MLLILLYHINYYLTMFSGPILEGMPGARGPMGHSGPKGQKGAPGKSLYLLEKQNIY